MFVASCLAQDVIYHFDHIHMGSPSKKRSQHNKKKMFNSDAELMLFRTFFFSHLRSVFRLPFFDFFFSNPHTACYCRTGGCLLALLCPPLSKCQNHQSSHARCPERNECKLQTRHLALYGIISPETNRDRMVVLLRDVLEHHKGFPLSGLSFHAMRSCCSNREHHAAPVMVL